MPSQLKFMKQLKVQTPAKVQSQIKQLKQALPLPDLMEAMDFGDYAKKSCSSPFRDDKNPSFEIYQVETGWLFKDHGTGLVGDELQFIATVHGFDRHKDFAKVLDIYRTLAKVAPPKRIRPLRRTKDQPVNLDPKMFLDAEAYEQGRGLLKPSRQILQQMAHERPYGLQGLLWASERGVLKCKNECYYVCDKTGNVIEARRLDNKPFPAGIKSKAEPGSRKSWPVGIVEASKFRNIALVEGIPDFLIAHHIIQTEQPEPNCAPVGMLGSSSLIHEAVLPFFKGKVIRIFGHDDEAGRRAASRWKKQLLGEGCSSVEVYELSPFEGVNDLYDYWSQHGDLCERWMPNN